MATAKKKEYPLAHVLDKEPTALQSHFHDWTLEQTGYQIPDDPAEAYRAGHTQSTMLRMTHQASEENQARLAENKEAASAAAEERAARKEEREAKRVEREEAAAERKAKKADKAEAPAPAKKVAPKKRAPKPAVEEDEEEGEEATVTPIKRGPRRRKPGSQAADF